MEESVKSRTIEFVKAKGIKMKVFEERCGLSSGYVTSMRRRKLRALLSLPRSLSPTLNYAGIFQIKSRKKSKKEIKKEATPILGEASCGKLCMCTRFAVFGYIYLHFPNL